MCNTHLPLLFASVTSRVVFSTCDPYSKIIFLNSSTHEVIIIIIIIIIITEVRGKMLYT